MTTMERFSLVIAGSVPTDKVDELHRSIPTLVRGMREFGADIDRAVSLPNGGEHHDHPEAQLDASTPADGESRLLIENELGGGAVDVRQYSQMMEQELARLASFLIDHGAAIRDGESIVDVAIAKMKSDAPVSRESDYYDGLPDVPTPAERKTFQAFDDSDGDKHDA